jgi:hypothetical protein
MCLDVGQVVHLDPFARTCVLDQRDAALVEDLDEEGSTRPQHLPSLPGGMSITLSGALNRSSTADGARAVARFSARERP